MLVHEQSTGASVDPRQHQQFAELFVTYQARVYGYITTLLPNRHDADDVFQQTSLILWKKWEQFDPSRSFVPWACGIAHNEVRNFLRCRGADHVVFNEKLIADLADVRLQSQAILEPRRLALVGCMKKLDFMCRQLLERCYAGRESIQTIAQQFHTTPNALYLRLRRIRRDLHQCIHRAICEEAAAEEDLR
jgi:RNA polymerase sigma-70 factor (ECF subfamily)